MPKVITEITPLSEKDCFYLVDRHKETFTFPIHRHEDFELNLIENCRGARRIVGDSMEEVGPYDLVLVGGNLEHGWEQHQCESRHIREVTIQFSPHLFSAEFLDKAPMMPVKRLLGEAASGLAFGITAIMQVYQKILGLSRIKSDFYRMIELLELLYLLGQSQDYRRLSSSTFAQIVTPVDSRRVRKVQEYLNQNFKQEIRLPELAALVGMSPTAFSRFFKLRTGRSVTDYLIDIRIGYASRRLVDSLMSVAEICYDSGFNNVSNFNRIFKRKKGCTPKEFRENYNRYKPAHE